VIERSRNGVSSRFSINRTKSKRQARRGSAGRCWSGVCRVKLRPHNAGLTRTPRRQGWLAGRSLCTEPLRALAVQNKKLAAGSNLDRRRVAT
jgi:hypothetical protein